MAAEIKVEKDIEAVREIIKEIGTIEGDVRKIEVEWNKYINTVGDKEYGSDAIGKILKELFDKKYRYDDTVAVNYNMSIESTINSSRSLKAGLIYEIPATTVAGGVNTTDKQNVATKDLKKNFKLLLENLFVTLNKPEHEETYRSITTDNNKKKKNIANKITDSVENTAVPAVPAAAAAVPASNNNGENFTEVTNFLNTVKEIHTTNESTTAYSEDEKNRARAYFSENTSKIKTTLAELEKKIVDKTNECLSKLINIASKYSSLDTRIKKDVLEKLKPTNISLNSDVKIIEHTNKIVLKFIEDFDIKSNLFYTQTQQRAGSKKKKVRGGDDDKSISPSFDGKPRDIVIDIFKNKIFININIFKKCAEDLYKGLNRFSNPEMGDTSKGEDSLFNKLFEKYMKTKDDTNTEKGGPFIASTELINDLKSNDLYPEDVLEIDMRDKFIFIAVTLFMRILSLMIIEIIIDRKMITRMDSAIFWYGITMTLFIIVFVLMVNFDSYKLRIIFNYVNFHIGYSTTFSYIFQLWLFGGMVYYIMLKINDDVISSSTNDEDRARLKHKVQVISMITWFFLSLGVLLM